MSIKRVCKIIIIIIRWIKQRQIGPTHDSLDEPINLRSVEGTLVAEGIVDIQVVVAASELVEVALCQLVSAATILLPFTRFQNVS